MATATAWSTILGQLLDEVPNLGWLFTGTATSGGATLTTTDPELNKMGSNAVASRFQGLFLYIPSATGADITHSVTTISVSGATATVTTLGNYGSTYTTVAMYLLAIHPDVLRRLGSDALEYIPVEVMIPLYHGPDDADLQDSDTVDASWTETNATDSTQTTAAEVWQGARSLVVTDSGSGGGYTESATVRMGHGARGTAFAIGKSDTGTSGLRVVDQDGNTIQTVSFTQEDWLFVKKSYTLDSTDEGVKLRLLESTVSAAGDWQFAWVVKEGSYLFRNLPGWLDERFKFKGIARAIFHEAGDEADTWLADSVEFQRLQDSEYRFILRQADANPNGVMLERHLNLDDPYFLILDAPYSAPYGVAAIFTADSDTTLCPAHLLTAYCKKLLGERYPTAFPGLELKGQEDYAKRNKSRANDPVGKVRAMVRRVFG